MKGKSMMCSTLRIPFSLLTRFKQCSKIRYRDHSKDVEVTETTLRDGLQAFPRPLPTQIKTKVINQLAKKAHFSSMEIGSIVDPKRVPNMADTPGLIENLAKKPNVKYWVLVANQKGFDTALKIGATHISFPTSVSETFTQKNINCSIEQSLDRISAMLKKKEIEKELRIRVYLSCCPICPDEGEIPVDKIADLAYRLFQMKCDEIFPSDTIGKGTPHQFKNMLKAIHQRGVPMSHIGLHLHGNGIKALENVEEALTYGVRRFDASMGNLGGCPIVAKAKGNIPVEELVPFLHQKGYLTGINVKQLLKIRQLVLDHLSA